jgi:hypothetical protein
VATVGLAAAAAMVVSVGGTQTQAVILIERTAGVQVIIAVPLVTENQHRLFPLVSSYSGKTTELL